ncbi:MAG: ABC transporter permease [Candidatus Bathyarchaeia archaeon]
MISAAIFLKDGVDPNSVLHRYADRIDATRFRPWTQSMPDLKELIDLNVVSMTVVMVLVSAIVALSISCAFVIFILKHLREAGIMKSMGVMSCELACLVTGQIVLVTLAASTAGVLAGACASMVFARVGLDLTAFTSHNQYFTVSGVIYPRLTTFSLCLPPVLATVFALLAAVWPSVLVIRKKAAEILRSA